MDILELIKKRASTRKYKDQPIPKEILDKIIEAGIWAPSVHNLQPWFFIVVKDKCLRKEIVNHLNKTAKNYPTSVKIFTRNSVDIIANAPAIILVFNTLAFSRKVAILGKPYTSVANISEVESIAASIENMYLMATSLGLGMVWLTAPLLAKNVIAKLFEVDYELTAAVALGWPRKTEKYVYRHRKKLKEVTKYI